MRSIRHAFTLVELLVVIAIIAALLALLMPAMSKAVEQGHRAVCASHIRGTIQYGLTYAAESFGVLPDLADSRGVYGSPTVFPWYLRVKHRNTLKRAYGMTREFFYCPSNSTWNTDAFWNEAGADSDFIVFGYAWYGNNRNTNESTTPLSWVPAPTRYPVCANKLSDQTDREVLLTDLTRSGNEQFNYPNPGGANHIAQDREAAPAVMPAGYGGTNVGNRDGSVAWRTQSQMQRQWWLSGATTYRFYY